MRTAPAPKAALALADRLDRELVRLSRSFDKVKYRSTEPGSDGIERAAYAILLALVREGAQRTSRLAGSLHAKISTISRQSSSLVQLGLVERQADPRDRRAFLLAVTAEGRLVFEETRERRNRWLAEVLDGWTEEDRRNVIRLFGGLNTEIETHFPVLAHPAEASR